MMTETNNGQLTRITGSCVICKKEQSFDVPTKPWQQYAAGVGLIQETLCDVSPDTREMIISGTCPECFSNLGDDDA